ncbi:flagellar basal body P-ring formation protein FlgA [Bradyrhizobium sp. U87765 SZCCT0131]|uniref:flagellar basal body P-ring formation chaperone FlgA n=1 Tax=unclassified Bradyrhizobium TaxID=2631580 RepID=UPI001BAC2AA7|nr:MULTISPECIES: flagellar basal body P-ring formation chaperone FlgA [unclassified Bradyrhizobium]MBR1219757.1 flagellar basal body P-ring formation protein FlgA [Bradyrhizobium sp. U87765 SZCCT0131]MBR1262408.1 flagellar basal body P-ring formation protein FlgA [Bradyrhizobium sp. U87765 SZCCT0134]MBR1308409.1 flagellar basal body P-ring formation protein FlgA [Bradyrhizobium sp. U87765 SZCCT0110]MBR1318190.1 flagellar basal body P-ring formation protein FlgA [Bradyrhizobium sp. U87765 SZCCT0
MILRALLVSVALLGPSAAALAQSTTAAAVTANAATDAATLPDAISEAASLERIGTPVLRASVSVSSDVVRIGDLVDNAGSAAQIAVYRAPDLGTTGALSTAQVLATLRNYQVTGVDTGDLQEISVTRLARTLTSREIEKQVGRALERRNGLGNAADLTITFDRDLRTLQLDPTNTGSMQPIATRYDARNGRFDVLFEIANGNLASPTRLRFTGTAIETIEAVVLTRGLDRGETVRASDVAIERRPKVEVGKDGLRREQVIGMQTRKPIHSGQVVRMADIAKPDLVQRDQPVTLIYQTDSLYLTMRAKAVDSGSEGDSVSVLNPQSKRVVQGVVTGPAQVTISVATPRAITLSAALPSNSPAVNAE